MGRRATELVEHQCTGVLGLQSDLFGRHVALRCCRLRRVAHVARRRYLLVLVGDNYLHAADKRTGLVEPMRVGSLGIVPSEVAMQRAIRVACILDHLLGSEAPAALQGRDGPVSVGCHGEDAARERVVVGRIHRRL